MAFYLSPTRMSRSAFVETFATPVRQEEVVGITEANGDEIVLALAGDSLYEALALLPTPDSLNDFLQARGSVRVYTIPLNVLLAHDLGWTQDEILDFLGR